MGVVHFSGTIGRTAAGFAVPTPVPVDDPAQFLSDDAAGLSAVARGTEKVSRRKGRRGIARSGLSQIDNSASAKLESQKIFSGRRRKPSAGRCPLPGISGASAR